MWCLCIDLQAFLQYIFIFFMVVNLKMTFEPRGAASLTSNSASVEVFPLKTHTTCCFIFFLGVMARIELLKYFHHSELNCAGLQRNHSGSSRAEVSPSTSITLMDSASSFARVDWCSWDDLVDLLLKGLRHEQEVASCLKKLLLISLYPELYPVQKEEMTF